MYVTFDDTLVTGNEMIDSQHKEWIDRINQLMKSCETDKEKQAAMKMLDYMADYADFHFAAEEKLQEEIGYRESRNIRRNMRSSAVRCRSFTRCWRNRRDRLTRL